MPTEAEAHNAAIEAAELAHWNTAPDTFCGYIVNKAVSGATMEPFLSTWRGVKLGVVYLGRSYHNNFGALIRSIEVKGSNGATYYGRYAENSTQFIQLRKRKG